jgi:Fe-S-cluster containining protein
MREPLPLEVNEKQETKINQASLQFESKPYALLNAAVYFNGQCEQCRPHCGAICCRAYGFVSLTEEEAKSGRYAYKEVSDECDCDTCKRMRELGLRYAVLKHPDGSCIYLDGNRKCSIYKDRPGVCRSYSCVNVPFVLIPS